MSKKFQYFIRKGEDFTLPLMDVFQGVYEVDPNTLTATTEAPLSDEQSQALNQAGYQVIGCTEVPLTAD